MNHSGILNHTETVTNVCNSEWVKENCLKECSLAIEHINLSCSQTLKLIKVCIFFGNFMYIFGGHIVDIGLIGRTFKLLPWTVICPKLTKTANSSFRLGCG